MRILLLVSMLVLTGCKQLPVVLESGDYVQLEQNNNDAQTEQLRIVATSEAYSQTISLKKLESNNVTALNKLESNNSFYSGIVATVGSTITWALAAVAAVIIGVVTIVASADSISNYLWHKDKQDERIREYSLLEQKEDNRHKETVIKILSQERIEIYGIDAKSRLWLIMVDRLGIDGAFTAVKEADDNGKQWTLSTDDKFLLVDKQRT